LDDELGVLENAFFFQANVYASSNLIVTMGEDFNYQNAEMWFKNLDKLMTYVNAQVCQADLLAFLSAIFWKNFRLR
jgi:hypothetical protein